MPISLDGQVRVGNGKTGLDRRAGHKRPVIFSVFWQELQPRARIIVRRCESPQPQTASLQGIDKRIADVTNPTML